MSVSPPAQNAIAIIPTQPKGMPNFGERFTAGVVLYTGTAMYPLAAGITAAPLCTLWA